MTHDVIVVGAGIAGLALARGLRACGRAPLVLERARGVGGRCATRRVEAQPVDHGLPFFHGRSEDFLAELDAVSGATLIPDWPLVVEGEGLPCRPEAFAGTDRRLAFGDGVSWLAKHLARGLNVRLETEVAALRLAAGGTVRGRHQWELVLKTGEAVRADAVALTMPVPSTINFLRAMEPLPEAIAAQIPLLELVRTLPCLAVITRYASSIRAPEWQAIFPRSGTGIQAILHDSSKRAGTVRLMLVLQAGPRFSAKHLDDPVGAWTRALLQEAATLHGHWIAEPDVAQSHVWKRARVAAGSELAGPLLVELDGGALLGIAGDGFHDAGGVEGAYKSGVALAERFAQMMPEST